MKVGSKLLELESAREPVKGRACAACSDASSDRLSCALDCKRLVITRMHREAVNSTPWHVLYTQSLQCHALTLRSTLLAHTISHFDPSYSITCMPSRFDSALYILDHQLHAHSQPLSPTRSQTHHHALTLPSYKHSSSASHQACFDQIRLQLPVEWYSCVRVCMCIHTYMPCVSYICTQ